MTWKQLLGVWSFLIYQIMDILLLRVLGLVASALPDKICYILNTILFILQIKRNGPNPKKVLLSQYITQNSFLAQTLKNVRKINKISY